MNFIKYTPSYSVAITSNQSMEAQPQSRAQDDLEVEKDMWWTALVILMNTGGHPDDTKTKIKRQDVPSVKQGKGKGK